MTKFVMVLWILTSFVVAAPFFQDQTRGWHWYEAQEPGIGNQEPGAGNQELREGRSVIKRKMPAEIVAAYRAELENRLYTAWINPTPQNVGAYQAMQKDLVDRSKLFSTRWMQNVFEYPGLDHTLVSPVNHQGRLLQIDLEKQHTQQTIQDLSQTYGLFFFFAGDCPYCHEFAPIVKRFAETYGWEVIAISVDGGRVAEFPQVETDNGLFRAWGIKALPALFAVNPQTQETIPIAYGLTSLDEMEARIITLVGARS